MNTRLRTLLVDDVEDIRALLRVLMDQDGRFDVVGEASDGEEAVDVARAVHPDLVVLDLAMPVMDGLTALPALKTASPEAKVVILSGFPADQMGPAAHDAGAVGYLEKGGNVHTLAADIHDLAVVLVVVDNIFRESLPPEAASAGKARQLVTSALVTDVSDSSLDTLVLLTSEVVTNAVSHARTSCHLAVELFPDVVRVSVADESATIPRPRDAGLEDETGRGLTLVETLSSNWGVIRRRSGKTVWFEVPRTRS